MATQEKTWNVANRLHSLKDSDNPEVNHIIAGADEIYDDAKGAKQSNINAQADAALADRYTKAETYSKEQLNSLITTPDVNYVTVATFADLPQTGESDTVYRVSSYDGVQVDATKYALYAWDGTTYQLLAVRSAIGEVVDVSEINSGATYADLSAALDAVPASVQRGGMSIKFIQRTNIGTAEEPVYNDEYVQYRYMGTSIATADFTNTANWQGIDDEPTPGSRNLVESGGIAKVYGKYKDDDEWVYTLTDKDSKFIFGIKKDGSIEWSVGVPTPIQKLVNSIVIGSDGVNLDGLNKIATFLNEFSTEDSLKALLDAKVNTEEGKGLIPSQYVEEVDNSEMLQQVLDAAGRVIESTHIDGTKEINWNLKVGGDFETPNRKESTEDSGYVKVLLDANNKLIMGVGGDGDVVFGKVPSQIQRLIDEKEDKGVNPNRKIVRLLSIGNSYSDDALAYVPFILQNMGIDVDLQIGILMRSSASLQNHVDNFNYTKSGDTERGNVYGFRLHTGGDSWQVSPERSPNTNPDDNQNGVSIQWALDNYKWDIICLQQSSQGAFNWETYQPHCNQLINLITDYVDYPIKFIWYMPQARPATSNSGANWSDEVITEHYESTASAANKILNETCCEYVVPVGTAIQNARTIITLKVLGDYANNSLNTSGFGYLTPNDGVHLQEGLPCQIAAYTFVLAILYLYGFEEHSIISESTRVTSAWASGKNIPSPHGTPIDSTDENCLIAQKCAIMALRHPFEVTDMNYIVNPE